MKNLIIFIIVLFFSGEIFGQYATKLYTSKPYYIQSAINYGVDNNGFWDLPGYPKEIEKGMNLQVFNFEEHKDRKFYMVPSEIDGFYEIVPGWQKDIRIDVQGGATNMKTNGANLHTWTKNGKDWQKFRFQHLGNGKFKILTATAMVICLNNRSSENGSNIHLWEDHEGPWMEWYLIDTETKKPFIPLDLPPFDITKPDFFERNKDKVFVYKSSSPNGLSIGTAKVNSITDNVVKLSVEYEGPDPASGKPLKTKTEMTINYKDGNYKIGNWDCLECAEGVATIFPDGKQVLSMSGEMHGIDFIIEAP